MKALLCFDGSDASANAIARAGALLAPAEALVVYVWLPLSQAVLWNPMLGSPGPLLEQADVLDESGEAAAAQLAEHGIELAAQAGFTARPVAARHDRSAWRTICEICERERCDVIVVGSHGQSAVSQALLGSTAAGLVHHARVPVLVVPMTD